MKLPNLHMLIKQKSRLLPRSLALVIFGELLIVFSTKVNLQYLLYSTARRCCLLHLIKQNCLLKTFLRTLILMTQVSLYLFCLLELIWNCIIFLYHQRWLKRSKSLVFQIVWTFHQWSLYLRMFGKTLLLHYRPVSLFSVVSKVLEKLVNNKIVDHLKKCGLFFISSVVLGLLDQLQIFSQLYLIELLGIFVRSYLSCSSWCIQGFWHGLASWSPQTLGLWCFRSDIWLYFYLFLVIGRFKWFWMVFTRISS